MPLPISEEIVKHIETNSKISELNVYQVVLNIQNEFKNTEMLVNFTPKAWLQCRNEIIVEFIMSTADMSNLDSNKKCLAFSIASLVIPLAFARNLYTPIKDKTYYGMTSSFCLSVSPTL